MLLVAMTFIGNAVQAQTLQQARLSQDSLSKRWKTVADELWNKKRKVRYQLDPEFWKVWNQCEGEITRMREQAVVLAKLGAATADTVPEKIVLVAEYCDKNWLLQQKCGDWLGLELSFSTVTDTLKTEKAKKQQLNAQLEAYRTAMEQNTNGLLAMRRATDSLEVVRQQLLANNSELRTLHLAIADARMRADQAIAVLKEQYRAKGPNGFPAVYKEVFPDVFPVAKDDKHVPPPPDEPRIGHTAGGE